MWRISLSNPLDTSGDYGLIGNFPSDLGSPQGLGIAPNGDGYVIDNQNSGSSGRMIWRVNISDPDDTSGDYGEVRDYNFGFASILSIEVDGSGNLWLTSDFTLDVLSRLNANDFDTTDRSVRMNTNPRGLAFDADGDIILLGSSSIWRLVPANITGLSTMTGFDVDSDLYESIGSLPTGLNGPSSIGVDSNGDAIITSTSDNSIWRVNLSNTSDVSGVYGSIGILPSGLTPSGLTIVSM